MSNCLLIRSLFHCDFLSVTDIDALHGGCIVQLAAVECIPYIGLRLRGNTLDGGGIIVGIHQTVGHEEIGVVANLYTIFNLLHGDGLGLITDFQLARCVDIGELFRTDVVEILVTILFHQLPAAIGIRFVEGVESLVDIQVVAVAGYMALGVLVDHEIGRPVDIATVHIKNGEIDHVDHSKYLIDSNATSKEIYGLETNKFHKVNLVCLSPNHWDGAVGNKHYFFMLDGAKSPEAIRGFHNEFLIPELLEHRKVMEVLGAALKVESTDKQLSGLGFNATVRDEVVLRLQGSHKRVIKVKF